MLRQLICYPMLQGKPFTACMEKGFSNNNCHSQASEHNK